MPRPVAIVTGAGRSLGRAIAERLHDDGYTVAVTDRDFHMACAVASELDEGGSTARPFKLDVSVAHQVDLVFEAVTSELGIPRALVNNAGIYPSQSLLAMEVEDWDAVVNVNLRGTFLCTRAFARLRVSTGGGAIVNLASTAAFSARVGTAHYSASKAAVVMFTRSCAQEFASHGIRANSVAPGLIEVRDDQVSPAYRDLFLSMIPRGRTGKATDISATAAFLLSDAADFINGECIVVDGGFLAGRPLPPLKENA